MDSSRQWRVASTPPATIKETLTQKQLERVIGKKKGGGLRGPYLDQNHFAIIYWLKEDTKLCLVFLINKRVFSLASFLENLTTIIGSPSNSSVKNDKNGFLAWNRGAGGLQRKGDEEDWPRPWPLKRKSSNAVSLHKKIAQEIAANSTKILMKKMPIVHNYYPKKRCYI